MMMKQHQYLTVIGKLVLLAALMGGGLYIGFESGAFRKAGNWIKSKIRKGNRSKDKAE